MKSLIVSIYLNYQSVIMALLGGRVIPLILLVTVFRTEVQGYVFRRVHELSESRYQIPREFGNDSVKYDVVAIENYLRNYLHGPQHDRYMYFNQDSLAVYVGPREDFKKNGSTVAGVPVTTKTQPVRGWAVFDKRTKKYCDLDAVFNFGELAIFTCPTPGLYRAYAIKYDLGTYVPGTQVSTKEIYWVTRKQKDQFNLLEGDDTTGPIIFQTTSANYAKSTPLERMELILKWESGSRGTPAGPVSPTPAGVGVVSSDPVVVKGSHYCYYWMYQLTEISSPDDEYLLFELDIWVAEPSAVGFWETENAEKNKVEVSDYSRVITNRFFTTGLFPCVRQAHPALEIVQEIRYRRATDQSPTLQRTPHWNALIKVHKDRLISTLSDVTFTIASRQNTGSFHCFVGDTRVFINHRLFDFVPISQLHEGRINLEVSNIDIDAKLHHKFKLSRVWGHGVHYLGYKAPKRYQPASTRSDMVIFVNPCIAQEFALAVGGSLYVADGLLQKGSSQTIKVALPFFPDSKNPNTKKKVNLTNAEPDEFLRIADVAFTPTHVAFLMSEGYLVLHSPSVGKQGLADFKETMKYRPDAFVKRRWCSRTTTPKISRMIVPVFSTKGTFIILQVYPTEGNVRVWFTPPSQSCLVEGHGFVEKALPQEQVINETEIHYEEFAAVRRTNHKTGLLEPPPPKRPPPPPAPDRNLDEEKDFLLDSTGLWIEKDPHFPPEVIDPASHVVSQDLHNYNQIVTYVIEEAAESNDGGGFSRILSDNGLNLKGSGEDGQTLVAVEFTVEEKEFMYALVFEANEIDSNFLSKPYKMVVSTVTIENFPYRTRLQGKLDSREKDFSDEKLETVTFFPGAILIRSKPFKVDVQKSRDMIENDENTKSLSGSTQVDFNPELFPLGTSIPSYVLNLGDILVYSSIENRYARPLHYYPWDIIDNISRSVSFTDQPPPLTFKDATTKFEKTKLYDPVVTEQGMISVLWRKERRHIVLDDPNCLWTDDADQQTVAMGSALVLEGLREIKAFFKNDNIFQRATPDGEIIYGVFDVKPRPAFRDCFDLPWNATQSWLEPCVEQPVKPVNSTLTIVPVCTKENAMYDRPCRDPGYIQFCTGPTDRSNGSSLTDKIHACLRLNSNPKCPHSNNTASLREDEDAYKDLKPKPNPDTNNRKGPCDPDEDKVVKCFPKHATREEIRSVNIIGTSFESYLQGSLQEVKSIHPESLDWEEDMLRQEPDICPFASFQLYHRQLDFAEVGYQTRITGEISYFGTGVPTEADLLVEYEQHVGIIVDITSHMVEERHFTTIRKTVDIKFAMTDYLLYQLLDFNPAEKHYIRQNQFAFEDVRAREPFSVFSITLRPSIVNTRCKNTDFFKTVQFNVGCNAYSNMRLMSEATPLKRINWTEVEDEEGFKWIRDESRWTLQLPKQHIYYRQVRGNVFDCNNETGYCDIPYYHLFRNDIFTISYRDFLEPKFEQFLTVSSRTVTGNVVLYDMLGSHEFNWTLNKLYAGCHNTEHFWYQKVLDGTKFIHNETFEHENLYQYYKDCFSTDPSQGEREQSQNLYVSPYRFFNKTNKNMLKFLRKRNQLFIFRAVALNTIHNRFTYCKHLDTFFMIRVTGIPIPRQGLQLWMYLTIFLFVFLCLIVSYLFFSKFYSGINTSL